MLKVALVSPYFPPFVGGIETYVYELARKLKDNCLVYIFTSGSGTTETYHGIKVFRLRALDVRSLPFPPRIPYPIPISFISKLAKTDVDIIHAHGHAFFTSFEAAVASKVVHKPFILTVHDIGVAYRDYLLMRGIRPLFDSTIISYVFKQAKVVIASNKVTYNYALRFKPRKVVVIPQGVDCERFKPESEGEHITFIAARLIPIKGGETFIRAIPHILKEVGGARFMVIGDGIQRPFLEKLSRELGVDDHVVFEGKVAHEEVPMYLNRTKVAVFPGYSGLTLLEAAAMKRPIITIETKWAKDALGDTPIFVHSGNSKETAEAIIHLLLNSEERKKIAELAYEKVTSERDWNTVASRHIELYEHLVGRGVHDPG